MANSIRMLTGFPNELVLTTLQYCCDNTLSTLKQDQTLVTFVARELFHRINHVHQNQLIIRRTIRAINLPSSPSWRTSAEGNANIKNLDLFFKIFDFQTIHPFMQQESLSPELVDPERRQQAIVEWDLSRVLKVEALVSPPLCKQFVSSFQRLSEQIPLLSSYMNSLSCEVVSDMIDQANRLATWWKANEEIMLAYWLASSSQVHLEVFTYALRYDLRSTIIGLRDQMLSKKDIPFSIILQTAIVESNVNTAKYLISRFAPSSLNSISHYSTANDGLPLYHAVLSGHSVLAELLLPISRSFDIVNGIAAAYIICDEERLGFFFRNTSQAIRSETSLLFFWNDDSCRESFRQRYKVIDLYCTIPHFTPTAEFVLRIGGQKTVDSVFTNINNNHSSFDEFFQLASQKAKDWKFLKIVTGWYPEWNEVHPNVAHFGCINRRELAIVQSLLSHVSQEAIDKALIRIFRVCGNYPPALNEPHSGMDVGYKGSSEYEEQEMLGKQKTEFFWAVWERGSSEEKAKLRMQFPGLKKIEPAIWSCVVS